MQFLFDRYKAIQLVFGGHGGLNVKAKIAEQRQWDGQRPSQGSEKSDTPLPTTLPE